MTPEQISIIGSVAFIIEKIGTWPIGSLFMVIIIGPWVMQFSFSRSQEKRFEAVQQMYKNNILLVKAYEKLSNDQQSMIIMNTQAFSELTVLIKERIK